MKNIFTLLLAAIMLLSCISCSSEQPMETGGTGEGEDSAANKKDPIELQVEDRYVLVREIRTNVGDDSPLEQTEYFYNDYGNLAEDEYLDLQDNSFYQKGRYEYNDSQLLISYTQSGNGHEFNSNVEMVYYGGKLIEMRGINDSGKTTYTYDDAGNLIREDVYDGSESKSWVDYTYNEKGLLVIEDHGCRSAYGNASYYTYEYDDAGRLMKITQKTSNSSYAKIEVITDYMYDADGTLLSETESRYDFSGDAVELTITETYEYDSHGNKIKMTRDFSNDHTYTDYYIEYEYMLLSEHLNG